MSQTGYATLADAIEELTRRGFTEHFEVVGRALRALESGKAFRAEELLRVSDPDDMSIVYAIESHTGTRGILVDAFGVYSNPMVSAFLKDVPIYRTAPAEAEAQM